MSLRVWLPLNGTLDNLGTDNIELINNSATSNDQGKIGKCWSFNGSSSYMVSSGESLDLGIKSICFWAYITNTGNYVIFTDYKSGLAFGVYSSYIPVSCSASSTVTYPKSLITLNQWNHIAVVKRNSTIELWINGVKQTAGSSSDRWSSGITDKLAIGARPNGNDKLNGRLNDFRMYDHELSEKEIHDIGKALVLHYPLDNNGGGGINLLENSSMSVNLTNWVTSGFGSESGIVSEDGSNCLKITGALTTTRYIRQDVLSDIVNDTVGTTYTISAYVKIKNVVKGTTNPMCEYYFGGSYDNNGTSKWMGATTVSGNYDFWTLPNDQWTKCIWIIRFAYVPTAMQFHVYSRDMTGTMFIKDIKMERGSIATGWSPSPSDLPTSLRNIIYDCSGYHNDGILNSVDFESSSPKYEACSVLTASKYSYVKTTENKWMAQAAPELTINLWAYSDNWSSMGSARLFSCTESGGFNTEAGNSGYIRFPNYVYTTESLGSPAYRYSSNELKLSSLTTGWHMLTFIRNLSGNKVYVDSEFHSSTDFVNYGECFNLNARLFLGCEASSASPSSPYTNAKMSDFRIYYSELSAEDIKELYNVGASVDNKYNIHTHEYIEDNYSDNPSIYKSGIVKASAFVENFSEHTLKDLYDTVYYTESDGSKWIRIFHHNNPASKLFSSTNNFIDRVYIDSDRWFDISICNYVSRWELMVKQKTTSSATETKYRWIQFVNPMIGTFNETKAADVIKIITSGYTNVSNAGGIIQGSSENTYMTINNGTSGNWYGAIGCWTAYNSGIPGYPNSVVTSGYMDLYLRIDDPGIYKEFISGNELIEI